VSGKGIKNTERQRRTGFQMFLERLPLAQQGSNPVFYRADYQLFNHYLQSWSPVWTPHFPRDENIPIIQAFAGICKLVIFLCLK
jgi:hypothetical protein